MRDTLDKLARRHRGRSKTVMRKWKRREYPPDGKAHRRAEWNVNVLRHAERYKITRNKDHGFALLKMWDYQITIGKCLPIRDALYRGEISDAEYVKRCGKAFHAMSPELIALGVSNGFPASFIEKVAAEIRDAQKLIVDAPADPTPDEFRQLCDSDNLRIRRMYRDMVDKFLVIPNG